MMKDKKILPPPWIAFPDIERYSIGWRWGIGESYIMKWGAWLDALSKEEQEEYKKLFPEPITWKGYWDDEDDGECYEKDEFFVQFWRKNGVPKYCLEQVQKEYSEGVKQQYNMFWGHQPSKDGSITKSCFSQWWMAEFYYPEETYCCMEQFMMAMKAEVFGDEEIKKQIMNASSQKQIKELGRKVRNFDEKVWNEVKYAIVLNGNYFKFTQNEELRKFLLETEDAILVEASPFDAVWGIHMSQNDKDASNPLKWQGSNLLGFALMEVRDEIRRVWENAGLCENVEEVLSR